LIGKTDWHAVISKPAPLRKNIKKLLYANRFCTDEKNVKKNVKKGNFLKTASVKSNINTKLMVEAMERKAELLNYHKALAGGGAVFVLDLHPSLPFVQRINRTIWQNRNNRTIS